MTYDGLYAVLHPAFTITKAFAVRSMLNEHVVPYRPCMEAALQMLIASKAFPASSQPNALHGNSFSCQVFASHRHCWPLSRLLVHGRSSVCCARKFWFLRSQLLMFERRQPPLTQLQPDEWCSWGQLSLHSSAGMTAALRPSTFVVSSNRLIHSAMGRAVGIPVRSIKATAKADHSWYKGESCSRALVWSYQVYPLCGLSHSLPSSLRLLYVMGSSAVHQLVHR